MDIVHLERGINYALLNKTKQNKPPPQKPNHTFLEYLVGAS